MEDSNRELVRRFYTLVPNQVEEAVMKVSTDYTQHHSEMKVPWVGRERYREHLKMLNGLFESLRFEPEEIVSEGDLVAVRYFMRGRTRDGKKVNLPGMDFLRVKDGLIEEAWGISDQALLAKQLGT